MKKEVDSMTDYQIKNTIKGWVNDCIKELKLNNENWIITCVHDCHGIMPNTQYSMTKLYMSEESRSIYGRHGEIIINLVPFMVQYKEIAQHKEEQIKKNIKRHLLYESQEAAHYDYFLHQDIISFENVFDSIYTNRNIYIEYNKLIKKYCNQTVDTRMVNTSCGYLEAFLLNNYKAMLSR